MVRFGTQKSVYSSFFAIYCLQLRNLHCSIKSIVPISISLIESPQSREKKKKAQDNKRISILAELRIFEISRFQEIFLSRRVSALMKNLSCIGMSYDLSTIASQTSRSVTTKIISILFKIELTHPCNAQQIPGQ